MTIACGPVGIAPHTGVKKSGFQQLNPAGRVTSDEQARKSPCHSAPGNQQERSKVA